jgi:hypothetical protein
VNLGLTLPNEFREAEFLRICESLSKHELATDEEKYGHRFDAMPFICPRDVWDRFGPMKQTLNENRITGDTDFFDRCKAGGVEIAKALDAISYHCGGLETRRNETQVITRQSVQTKVRRMLRRTIP